MKENTKFSKEVILKILDLGECVCGTCIENEVQLQSNLRAQLETAETQELQARLSKVGMLTRKLGQFSAEKKNLGHMKLKQVIARTFSNYKRC